MKNYSKLSEIKAKPIPRIKTGFDELDYIYGYSVFSEAIYWGMPMGKISLWAGTSGIGKSRLAIDIAKMISSYAKVLYFQTEADLEDFGSWVKDTNKYNNFYCSGESNIDNMIKIMYEVNPDVVIIDSVNEIEEFSIGSKKETRRIINGEDGKVGLKKAINDINGHLILLGQLNADGSIKGGTSLPHLVDIALNLVPADKECKSTFAVTVGIKHRYGRRDDNIYGIWYHVEEGVKCFSENRHYDDKWCNSHGLKQQSIIVPVPPEIETVKEGFVERGFIKQFLGIR